MSALYDEVDPAETMTTREALELRDAAYATGRQDEAAVWEQRRRIEAEFGPFPPPSRRSTAMADPARGLYGKFHVKRTDGKSAPGEKHDNCSYFVLDLTHDPFAYNALLMYASECRSTYPLLADDLERKAAAILDALRDLITQALYADYWPNEEARETCERNAAAVVAALAAAPPAVLAELGPVAALTAETEETPEPAPDDAPPETRRT